MGYAKWALAACFVCAALACARYDEKLTDGVTDGGHVVNDVADTGGAETGSSDDAGTDSSADGGGDAAKYVVLGTGIDDPAQVAVDGIHVYVTLGRNAEVRRCPKTTGCGATSELVASAQYVPSGLIVVDTNVFWSTGYRYIARCGTGSAMPCTPTQFADNGASSYPTALRANGTRLYWWVDSGSTRKIVTCPLSGCTTGYPKAVFTSTSGDSVHGKAVIDMAIGNNYLYTLLFTGGIVRLALTGAESVDAASMIVVNGTPYSSNAIDLDDTTLRWAIGDVGRIDQCAAPECLTVTTFLSGRVQAAGVTSDQPAVYGCDKGPVLDGGTVATDAGIIWRMLK